MLFTANLLVINSLKKTFNCDVGYSGHENGRAVKLSCPASEEEESSTTEESEETEEEQVEDNTES